MVISSVMINRDLAASRVMFCETGLSIDFCYKLRYEERAR